MKNGIPAKGNICSFVPHEAVHHHTERFFPGHREMAFHAGDLGAVHQPEPALHLHPPEMPEIS